MIKAVEDYILSRKEPVRSLLEYLHRLLLDYQLQPKIAYGIPMYYGHKWVCYLNPLKDDQLELAFPRAKEFTDPSGLLDFRDRKMVAGLILDPVEDLPIAAVKDILEAALALDQEKIRP
jgi:hypothetical protein